MENIYEHIEKLLVHNDYVVVPGLGGFILQDSPAIFDGAMLRAPRKVIAFNALMHHADGLLAIEYSRSNEISFRDAQLMIEKAVMKVKSELQTTGLCVFGNLGVLHSDSHGIISFEPDNDCAFIPENFLCADIFVPTAQVVEAKPHRKLKVYNFMRYAAMIVVAVTLQLMFTKISDSRIENSASIVDVNQLMMKKNATSSKLTADTVRMDSVEAKSDTVIAEQNKPMLEVPVVLDDDSLYHVVVASLGTLEAAQTFKKELEAESKTKVRILKPSSLYRVAIKSFVDYDDAIKYMKELRAKDEEFASAWVYCKK